MFETTGARLPTQKELDEINKELQGKTEEEMAQALQDALMKYAIGPDGQFTAGFKKFLSNPQKNLPTNKEEKDSYFALLLLLITLNSNLRSAEFKGAQAEQVNIETYYTAEQKKLKEKATTQFNWSFYGSLIGGATSAFGAYIGFRTGSTALSENPVAYAFTTTGRTVSETTSTWSQSTATTYDAYLTEIKKQQSRANFNQQSFNTGQNNAKEASQAAAQAAEEYQRSLTGVKSRIAGNV